MRCYEKALELKPGNPEMHLNRALAWLQMGDFERGWPEYEWRLKCKEYAIPPIRRSRGGMVGPLEGQIDLALRRPWVWGLRFSSFVTRRSSRSAGAM